ncbi:hypothetical protein ACP275_04G128800 [Erythranthe tilingii]
MAAAYAALVSLTHTLNQILHPPPAIHIIFDTDQIVSLRQKADFFVDFLENHSSTSGDKRIEDLQKRIGGAAYTAEYIIEFNVRNQILAGSFVDREKISNLLFEGLYTSKQEFLFIEKELVEFKKDHVQHKNSTSTEASSSSSSSSSRPLLPIGKNTMVGFDDHMVEIMGALSTDESHLRIISIVGMGGIGKTTLATHVYTNALITEYFPIRAWFTVSQEYTEKEILLGLLHQIDNTNRNDAHVTNDGKLGDKLYKTLFGRKYLIVMDDMWDIKAWDTVKRFLPDNNNRSRILVTTRLLKLAVDFGSCSPYQLNFLDEAQSWDLLRQKIFAEGRCPIELERIGKSIAKKCRGLPLALVVIGGLLAKSKAEHWKYVEEDVTSAVYNQDEEFCMKILSLSYNRLPIYLKPCFLYFAVFPEDYSIEVPRMVMLWVAEGFIRQCGHKRLEEIGREYLEDLIDRNLILVSWRSIIGAVRTCRIHDLLSDLSRREAYKENFILSGKLYNHLHILSDTKIRPTRLSIYGGRWKGTKLMPYRSLVPTRSFLSFSKGDLTDYNAHQFPLLRVLNVVDRYPKHDVLQLINSRYVSCMGPMMLMPSSTLSRLWGLQTIVVEGKLILPIEIWQMPQLRHIEGNHINMPHPPPPDDVQKIILLENLQTLSIVRDFKCCEKLIKRIPNVKTLRNVCQTIGSNNCLRNIGLLHKLEELYMECPPCSGEIVFPCSLKELSLSECKIPWEDMSVVGSLANLESLHLWNNAAVGQKWIPKEGEFAQLKYLLIHKCELEIWEADNTHFPCLEILSLGYLNLKEIPSDFAEILPLRRIDLDNNNSNHLLASSANEISEQRENIGYDSLRVQNITSGALIIWVKRGTNLVVCGGGHIGVIITSGNQRVETRVATKDVNPECDEELTILNPNESHPVSLCMTTTTWMRRWEKQSLILDHW